MKRRRILLPLSAALGLLLLIALASVVVHRLTHGVILVSAHLSYPDNERAPAQGAVLYLLDEDMIRLVVLKDCETNQLREKVFSENPGLRSLAGLMNARRREAYSLGPEVADFMEQSRPLWELHVVQSGKTDAEGRVTFTDIRPGDYWVMGRVESRGGVAFWNLSVQVRRGASSITLQPANALQCTGCR
ncbi:MAG TPA: carboxypeptidase-like regulatory domain-containing protein [Pyrinomonadaceae bacterium]|jgi:hypothetical protein